MLPALQHNEQIQLLFDELMKLRRTASYVTNRPTTDFQTGCVEYKTRVGLSRFLASKYNCNRKINVKGFPQLLSWSLVGDELFEADGTRAQISGTFEIELTRTTSPKRLVSRHNQTRNISIRLPKGIDPDSAVYAMESRIQTTPANTKKSNTSDEWSAQIDGNWRVHNNSLWLEQGARVMLSYRPAKVEKKPEAKPKPAAETSISPDAAEPGPDESLLEITADSKVEFTPGCPRPLGRFSWSFIDKTGSSQTESHGAFVSSKEGRLAEGSEDLLPWPSTCSDIQ